MHKSFYASGFLYHSPSQQILLQVDNTHDTLSYSLFSGIGSIEESAPSVFQRILQQDLGVLIPLTSINPIYDYYYAKFGKNHFIQYAQVENMALHETSPTRCTTGWIALKKLSKCTLTEQIRHDIIIGERVIRAAEDLLQRAAQVAH